MADLEVDLPRATVAPGDARWALRGLCADHVQGDLLIDAELLVSELVTNAVRHGDGRISLCARLNEDRLLVEVVDQGAGFERDVRCGDVDRIGGWGLGIVEDVSSRWGLLRECPTHVWFELELS